MEFFWGPNWLKQEWTNLIMPTNFNIQVHIWCIIKFLTCISEGPPFSHCSLIRVCKALLFYNLFSRRLPKATSFQSNLAYQKQYLERENCPHGWRFHMLPYDEICNLWNTLFGRQLTGPHYVLEKSVSSFFIFFPPRTHGGAVMARRSTHLIYTSR